MFTFWHLVNSQKKTFLFLFAKSPFNDQLNLYFYCQILKKHCPIDSFLPSINVFSPFFLSRVIEAFNGWMAFLRVISPFFREKHHSIYCKKNWPGKAGIMEEQPPTTPPPYAARGMCNVFSPPLSYSGISVLFPPTKQKKALFAAVFACQTRHWMDKGG